QRLAIPASERNLPCPMPADVVEGAQLPVEAMRDHDRLIQDADGHEIAHSLELVSPRNELPRGPEDTLFLAPQDLSVEVEARREGRGAGEGQRLGGHAPDPTSARRA